MVAAVALCIGWVLDSRYGDPACLPHPVVFFGRWITVWEKILNRGSWRFLKGAVLALLSIAGVYFGVEALLDCVSQLPGYWGICAQVVLSAVMIFFCLAGKTLRREVRMVFDKLLYEGIDEGRKQVARIVGRDTSGLSCEEICKAALETLAENLSDGVVAPIFWYCILGVPGMMAYKMVNTLDSMIGYRTDRYRRFGCIAARIDDLANYVPARITALLILIAAKIYRYCINVICARVSVKTDIAKRSLLQSILFVLHYGPEHASPNSGWPEAALAAVLDCQFGGPHYYFGELFYKPFIGKFDRPLYHHDMIESNRICFIAERLAVLISCVALILLHCIHA